jgi:hypothetical protein
VATRLDFRGIAWYRPVEVMVASSMHKGGLLSCMLPVIVWYRHNGVGMAIFAGCRYGVHDDSSCYVEVAVQAA